jgi:hypothetical protein
MISLLLPSPPKQLVTLPIVIHEATKTTKQRAIIKGPKKRGISQVRSSLATIVGEV